MGKCVSQGGGAIKVPFPRTCFSHSPTPTPTRSHFNFFSLLDWKYWHQCHGLYEALSRRYSLSEMCDDMSMPIHGELQWYFISFTHHNEIAIHHDCLSMIFAVHLKPRPPHLLISVCKEPPCDIINQAALSRKNRNYKFP